MKRLLILVGAAAASIALYVSVFSFVERPLTLGDLTKQLDYKLDYARGLTTPKILILAGSNGRYSHRCEQFTVVLGYPCVNGSIASGIGLDFLLGQYQAVLRRGDVVYMPLEYSQYAATEADMHRGVQNAVMLRHRREQLWSLPIERVVETFGAFDLPFLVRGVSEMGLARAGVRRRTGTETLTEQGDERGHSLDKSADYADYLLTAPGPDTHVPDKSYARDVLSQWLVNARGKGILVVGGLPSVPTDAPIDPADVRRIRMLFEDAGQLFIATASWSRYPRTCFFDTTYHLNELCQMQHSRVLAELLRERLAMISTIR